MQKQSSKFCSQWEKDVIVVQLVKGKKLFLYDDFHRAYKGVKKPVLDVRSTLLQKSSTGTIAPSCENK